MSVVTIAPTGALVVGGKRVFPVVLSNGPPPGGKARNGRDALAEVASAGVRFIRTGIADWSAANVEKQVAEQRALLDAAGAHGLQAWLWLGDAANLLPAR